MQKKRDIPIDMDRFGTMILPRGIGLVGLVIFIFCLTSNVGQSYASITITDTLSPPSEGDNDDRPYWVNGPWPITLNEDTSVTVSFRPTGVGGVPFTYAVQAEHGAVTGSGTNWTYTPNTNFFGRDQLSVSINGNLAGSLSVTVYPVPDPPVASMAIPAAVFFPGFSNLVVISTSCDQPAQFILDGSSSTDPDHDSLSYAWFDETNYLGGGVTNLAMLDAGVHTTTLFVTDGMFTNSASVTFEVISPCTALANLQRFVKRANLPKKLDRRLQPILVNVSNELDNGRIRKARNQLRDFQTKIASRVDPLDSQLAAQLETLSQEILDGLRDSAGSQAERR